jgi:hypothetical protein
MNARAAAAAVALALVPSAAGAHLNSPNIYLEEAAGPWAAITSIEMPSAIPGEARVYVHLTDLKPGEGPRVRLLEIPPDGEQAAPPWIPAKALAADASTFLAPMPLMTSGVWKARVEVSGPRGSGSIDIPVAATKPPSRMMTRTLVGILGALSTALLITATLISRALGRDVYARPGVLSARTVRYLPWITAVSFVAILGFHGLAWWEKDKQLAIRTSRTTRAELQSVSGPIVAGQPASLRLGVVYGRGKPVEGVVPDHGKMMHAVVVHVPDMTYFLHAHPKMDGPGVFALTLLPPEPGRYKVFADVLFPTGAAETVTATLEAAPGGGGRASTFDDPDDSDSVQPAFGAKATSGTAYDAGGGFTMKRISPAGPIKVNELLDLGFELDGPDGKPVNALQAYMGMAGHLLILRDDLNVFAHVHPMGTVSGRMAGMPAGHATMTPEEHAKAMAAMSRIEGARVSFPYGFPSAGRYRLFVQVKYADAVRTGVFDLKVE